MSLPTGLLDDKYEILQKLGEGGMGTVYKVRHKLLDDLRVIKVIRQESGKEEGLARRFHQEAKTAIRLRHPGIAQLYDFSVADDGTAVIVMEFIDGITLLDILKKSGPFDLGFAVEVALQALDALGYLHESGFVHRDISPDNLMLTRDRNGRPAVKLIDLGLAKRLDTSLNLTQTGAYLGKVRYSAPEQFGDRGVDARSDLYSFGVMFYELLTGVLPISGEQFSELVGGHLVRPPRGFDETDPKGRIPADLRQVVMRTMKKDPGDRVASADELAGLLEPFRQPFSSPFKSEEGTLIVPPPPGDPRTLPADPRMLTRGTVLSQSPAAVAEPDESRASIPASRRRLAMASAVVAVLALIAFATAKTMRPPVAGPPPEEEPFRRGVLELRKENWNEAAQALRRAIAAAPRSRVETVDIGFGDEEPYLPHYFLGVALFRLNNYELAWDEWQVSEEQGAVQATRWYEDLKRLRGDVEATDLDRAISRTEALLARADDMKGQTEAMLQDPGLDFLWTDSPQLAERARSVLERLEEARRQSAGAKSGGRYAEVRRAERTVQAAQDALIELNNEVLDLLDAAEKRSAPP